MPHNDPNISAQIEAFTRQLVAAVEAAATQRIQAALARAFGIPQKRGPGRPPKRLATMAPLALASAPARKKQLCPVPGCKNLAAPVFGMVCKEHKNVSKAKIKKYREERRQASPSTGAKPAAVKRAKRVTAKVKRARKLQGQYLGLLKSLTGANRANVKQTAKDKSVAEAVKLARSLKTAKQ
ncbi:MAG TPA: hypothetical protein VJ860_04855 [Polyangia bacterium]|jgi:hypothetical protein|nr:hypothetical protein [Polyangia bacterium]